MCRAYTEHDLFSAMRLYKQVMTSHPSDPEADYSRVQIQNIVNTVVPKQKPLDAQMDLILSHFEHSA